MCHVLVICQKQMLRNTVNGIDENPCSHEMYILVIILMIYYRIIQAT